MHVRNTISPTIFGPTEDLSCETVEGKDRDPLLSATPDEGGLFPLWMGKSAPRRVSTRARVSFSRGGVADVGIAIRHRDVCNDVDDFRTKMAMPTVMEEDLEHEENVLRAPHDVRTWWKYLQDRSDASRHTRHVLFERGLHALPGSYKVWRTTREKRW